MWGEDDAFGHLLRDGALAGRAPEATVRVPVLVVGAGPSGLSCAWRLRRGGLAPEDVLVVDAGETPGGTARGGGNEVSRWPWGAHYLRAPTPEHPGLEALLEEVGLLRGRDRRGRLDWDTRAVCAAPQERLWEGGLWTEGLVPARARGPRDDEAFEAFGAKLDALAARRGADGRRAFAIPVDRSSRDPDLLALDGLSLADWLEREGLGGAPALRWYLDYACRDDYGCRLETTSAWAGLHYFVAREGDDPSRDEILTWPEGNGRLVDLLAAARGGTRFVGRSLCLRLLPGAAPGAPSVADVWHADPAGGPTAGRLVRYEAEHLVAAVPRFVLARLLPAPPPDAAAFTYAPWLVVNVTLDEPPGGIGAPLAWDNVVHGSPSLGYVVANRDGPRGSPCVVTWYLPLAEQEPATARRALLEVDHAAAVDLALGELLRVHPTLRGRVRSVDAWRWGHAMVRPVPGFVWGPARAAALTRQDALLTAHADLSGIPIFEEAFYRGVLAAEEVLRRAGRDDPSILGSV